VPPFDLGSDPLREELDELALARSERRRPRLLAEEGDCAVTRAVDEHRHADVRVHALCGRGRRVLGLGHVGERHRFGRVPAERGRADRLRGVERRPGLVRSGPVGDALDRVRLVLDAREDPHVEFDVVAGEREQLRDRRVELGPRHRRLVEPVERRRVERGRVLSPLAVRFAAPPDSVQRRCSRRCDPLDQGSRSIGGSVRRRERHAEDAAIGDGRKEIRCSRVPPLGVGLRHKRVPPRDRLGFDRGAHDRDWHRLVSRSMDSLGSVSRFERRHGVGPRVEPVVRDGGVGEKRPDDGERDVA